MAIGYVNSASYVDSSSATSITINKPTNTTNGHTIILILAIDGNNPLYSTFTPPSGFTYVASQRSGYSGFTAAWIKTAGVSEPSSYTTTWSGGTPVAGYIITFSGCTNNPIDVYNNNASSTGTTTSVSGKIYPNYTNTMMVQFAMIDSNNNDTFSSFYDIGQGLSWTGLTVIGDNTAGEPVLGIAYVKSPTTSSLYGVATHSSTTTYVEHVIFNLRENTGGNLNSTGEIISETIYNSPGTYYYTVPYGTSTIRVKCWGGGGCGSATVRNTGNWGGGGGGGFAETTLLYPPPGSLLRLIVGAGGISSGTTNGGNSSVEISNQWGQTSWSNIATANGGTGVAAATTTGGSGGGGVGTIVYTGGTGATGSSFYGAGGGGGGAGSTENGNAGGNPNGGIGGYVNGGDGGRGKIVIPGPGNSGLSYGGGGGGSMGNASGVYNGGSGAGGLIDFIIKYALNTMVISSGM